MVDPHDAAVSRGSQAAGHEDHGHGLGSHALGGHDDHDSHGSGGDAWVLLPIAVGVVIAIVVIAIFALQSNAPALT
ncbi:MAG: hypothetical protein ACR2LA_00560 [Acidimicrobiales bacterium]